MIAIASPKRELGTRAEARTKEIKRCLLMNPSLILMLDDDETMPVRGLSAMIGAGLDIAIIDAPSKGRNDSNVVYHPDGTMAYATISCCLIKPRVFETITEPWFSSEYDFRQDGVKDGKIVWNVQKKYQDDNRGEDIYFIRKAIEAGLTVGVIGSMKCAHFDLEAR